MKYILCSFFYFQANAQVFIPFSSWKCQSASFSIVNTAVNFNLGTYSNTNISGNTVVLSTGNTTGTYTSPVIDIFKGCGGDWTSLEWKTALPYGKEIPTAAETVANYSGIFTTTALMTNLVGYWKFNESAAATTFADASGNSNTGNKQGTVTTGVTSAKLGYAITPNGTNGHVSTTNLFTSPGPTNFTLSVWFKTTTSSGGKLIGYGNSQTGSSASYDRHIYMNNSGQIYFGVYPSAVRTINSASTYRDGNWHHAVASLSSTAGMKLFINGSQVAADAATTTAQAYAGYFRIGYDNLAAWTSVPTSNFFSGSLDEVAVWTRTLSTTEIQQLYQRSGNNIKFQIKTCGLSDCSDVATWKGPDGSNLTYFSEANNNFSPASIPPHPNVFSTYPLMTFTSFSSLGLPSRPYFQYQATLSTDNTTFMPVVESISIKRP